MKRGILAGIILMFGLSSFGFSTGKFDPNIGNKCGNNRNERYGYDYEYERDKIISRHQRQINILNAKLTQVEHDIKAAQMRGDSFAVNRLTAERDGIIRGLAYERESLNWELKNLPRSEEERRYNEIVSRHQREINILNARLTRIEKKLYSAQIRRDIFDIRKLTTEKKMIQSDLEYEYELLNSELRRNNLADWSY